MAVAERKPVGGLAGVTLLPAGGIARVGVAEGRCTGITLKSGARTLECPLCDDGSSYTEESLVRDGLVAVSHTLTIAIDLEQGRELLGEEVLASFAREGAAALVTASGGERMLVGWSERFGCEQPLRLVAATSQTGSQLLDRPRSLLTLRSEDTSPAMICENEFDP